MIAFHKLFSYDRIVLMSDHGLKIFGRSFAVLNLKQESTQITFQTVSNVTIEELFLKLGHLIRISRTYKYSACKAK